jgi:hypothetical protein
MNDFVGLGLTSFTIEMFCWLQLAVGEAVG